jgi:uncharacterized protein YndB with AHSA1/START domain
VSGEVPAVERNTMTVQKSFKRLVRARMAKTGESYTTARAQLLAGDAESTDVEAPRLACSDERIRERTGQGWEQWFDLLDSWDAESMSHREIVSHVAEFLDDEKLAWNTQAIATSFERARGKRAVGERVGRDGFVAGASKTIAVSAKHAFAAFVDPSQRDGWLPDIELSERTVTKPTTARFDVDDGTTRLVVFVEAKGPTKSTVVVEHSRLADNDEREARKLYWRNALVRLKTQLEGSG